MNSIVPNATQRLARCAFCGTFSALLLTLPPPVMANVTTAPSTVTTLADAERIHYAKPISRAPAVRSWSTVWGTRVILPIFVGFGLGAVFIYWRRSKRRVQSVASLEAEARAPHPPEYKYNPIVIKGGEKDPDPWTERLTGSIIRPLWHRTPTGDGRQSVAPPKRSSSPPPPIIAEPVTQILSSEQLPNAEPQPNAPAPFVPPPPSMIKPQVEQHPSPPTPAIAEPPKPMPAPAMRQTISYEIGPLALPGELTSHFTLKPGEQVLHTVQFAVPMACDGSMAITKYRLLAVFSRTTLSLSPFGIMIQKKRHKVRVSRITECNIVNVPRISFLIPAGLLFWWMPWGMVIAILCVLLFFLVPRKELAVVVDCAHTRSYPLSPKDIENTKGIIRRLIAETATNRLREASSGDKVRNPNLKSKTENLNVKSLN